MLNSQGGGAAQAHMYPYCLQHVEEPENFLSHISSLPNTNTYKNSSLRHSTATQILYCGFAPIQQIIYIIDVLLFVITRVNVDLDLLQTFPEVL